MATKTISTGGYEGISCAGSYDYILVSGTEGNIKFDGDENLLDYVVAKVKDGNLIIDPTTGPGRVRSAKPPGGYHPRSWENAVTEVHPVCRPLFWPEFPAQFIQAMIDPGRHRMRPPAGSCHPARRPVKAFCHGRGSQTTQFPWSTRTPTNCKYHSRHREDRQSVDHRAKRQA